MLVCSISSTMSEKNEGSKVVCLSGRIVVRQSYLAKTLFWLTYYVGHQGFRVAKSKPHET